MEATIISALKHPSAAPKTTRDSAGGAAATGVVLAISGVTRQP